MLHPQRFTTLDASPARTAGVSRPKEIFTRAQLCGLLKQLNTKLLAGGACP